jgi:hypothetical protein
MAGEGLALGAAARAGDEGAAAEVGEAGGGGGVDEDEAAAEHPVRAAARMRAASGARLRLAVIPDQPSLFQVQPPLMSKAFAPARLTVSGPVKLLLSMMSLRVSVPERVAS